MAQSVLELEYEEVLERLKKRPVEEIAKEYAYYLWASQRIIPNPFRLMNWMGKYFRVIKRNYTTVTGVLLEMEIAPVRFRILVDEDRKEYMTGQVIHETKLTDIDTKSCLYWESIAEMSIKKEEEKK